MLFRIAISIFGITFTWLIWAFFNIKGLDITADISMSTLKAVVQSTEIDIPITEKNVRAIVWQIGAPLYLNLVSVCFLMQLWLRKVLRSQQAPSLS